MKKLIAALTLPLLMTACQSNGDDMAQITEADLQHHNWNLVQIDGEEAKGRSNQPVANLEIGEKMSANGNAGCNRFFGQGELKDNQFRIVQMGMTQKLCLDDVMKTERAVSSVLTNWSDMTLTKDSLVLKNSEHTLTFELNDWMD